VEVPRRHPLGLPAGSIRAILALGVLGLLWAIVLRYQYGPTEDKMPLAFVYLQMLMVLIVAHFFAAHGSTIGPNVSDRSPLGLPRGVVRFLLLAGYLGLAAFLYYTQPDFEYPPKGSFILLIGLLLCGFFLGHVLSGFMRLIGHGELPDWFLDFQAWIALLALFGMGTLLIVHLFINPSLVEQNKIDMPTADAILSAIVGFYFGARS
jgi:hypothetical protein